MAIPIRQIHTAYDLVEHGIRPTNAKENLAYVVQRRLERLRSGGVPEDRVFNELYPNTVIPNSTGEALTRALIAGVDVLVFGPPGTGKSKLAHDLISIFPAFTYVVDDCKYFQCNPFSLFDQEFYARVRPCPVCKATYGGEDYQQVRLFDPSRINPSRVKVRFVYLTDGFGISRVMGTPDTFPSDLTGSINLRLLEELGDPFHREVFTPGKLPQGNNGFVYLNEVGKIPSKTQSALLDAIQEKEVKPANTREPVPTAAVYFCDTNTQDLDSIIDPLNDRFLKIHFGYHPEVEGNADIIDRTLYEPRVTPSPEDYEGIWTADRLTLLDVPVPAPVKKGVAAFMVAYRGDAISDRYLETQSNRVMREAIELSIAEAKLRRRRVVVPVDVVTGLTQSILGRIRPRTEKQYREDRDRLVDYIGKKARQRIEEAAQAYWCEFQKAHPEEAAAAMTELANVAKRGAWEEVVAGRAELEKASVFWEFVKGTNPHAPPNPDVQAELLHQTHECVSAAAKKKAA